ncbi:MAG: TlpA family protein disulfide reductase [Alphaproteobacteria bacterium]|nr:TlpA family protein disulfide reductase [Alphaproteobacteria bacterium]
MKKLSRTIGFISTFISLIAYLAFVASTTAHAEMKMSIGKGRDITMLNTPEFVTRMPFKDENKKNVNINSFKGNLVLLSFWNTKCPHCLLELPSLDKLQKTFDGKKFLILPISVNNARNMSGHDRVSKTFKRYNIENLNIYIDSIGEFASSMKVGEFPTSILVDEKGHELGRIEGETDWMAIELKNFIKYMISEMEYRKKLNKKTNNKTAQHSSNN